MKKAIFALLTILAVNTFALDHIWDMRYTFGPDSKASPKLGAGLGIRSDFNSNVLFPVNLTSKITSNFDIGAKVDVQTYNEFDHVEASLDLGGRYRFKPWNFVEVDGYFGLNRNNGSAVVITFATEQFISKNFATYYEARAGFLDGVTGEDGYAKFSVGIIPTLTFGKVLRCMVEVNSSGSAGNLKDDFMVDIIPKIELSLGASKIRLDFDIGILQETNNDRKGIALYVMTAL